MKYFLRLLLGSGLLALPWQGLAQAAPDPSETHCLLLPLSLEQRAVQATLVVEAEVLDAESFREPGSGRLYTQHRLRVFSVLKGSTAPPELTVLTEGGTVGLDRQQLTNTLQLQPGEQGVLFLVPAHFAGTAFGGRWAAYGSEQGFLRYDLGAATAADPFRHYGRVTDSFYQTLTAATGQARRTVQPNPALAAALQPAAPVLGRGQAPAISSLAPASVTAGTGEVLTIVGSGFGATRGAGFVEFRNADNGGSSLVKPQESEYVSWSDTRIQVRVPSLGTVGTALGPAGSGPVRVTTADQQQATSAASLTVPYALSAVLETQTRRLVRPNHVGQGQSGGYTFQFESGFAANAAAVAAWGRALATWRCQTGINWDAATAPRAGRGAAKDGENSIGFDQGAELPAGILGRTTSYYQGCYRPDGQLVFYVQEIDMQFDDATSWQFGPTPAVALQLDFESVAVHELGHAQQLAHVILPRAIMHYAIARGQNSRTLSSDDVAGARQVLRTRSFVPQGCGPRAMLPAPLTTLAAASTAGGVAVAWATRADCFLSGFEVQRTRDTTSWQTLATLPATAPHTYFDAQPLPGLSYYRLRLRRPDGTADATAPELVTAGSSEALRPALFPNPVAGGPLRLQYPAAVAGRLSLLIYDAVGRLEQQVFADFQPGLNVLRVPTEALRPGWHLLRFIDSEGQKGALPFSKTGE